MVLNFRQKLKLSENNGVRRNYLKRKPIQIRPVLEKVEIPIRNAVRITAGILTLSWLFIFCHDAVTQAHSLRIQTITITGARKLSEKEIMDQADVHTGVNILSINLSTVRDRLLSNRWIAEAKVRRELPSVIHIDIREHEPIAILDMGRKFILDVDGSVFKEWEPSDPANLPVVVGLEFSDLNFAKGFQSAPLAAVMDILTIGQQTDSIIPACLIKTIQVDREMGITLYTLDRIRKINVGYGNYTGKLEKLKALLIHVDHNKLVNIEAVDLNSPDRIIVNPVKTSNS